MTYTMHVTDECKTLQKDVELALQVGDVVYYTQHMLQ